jgi:hypothetical protein
LVGPLEREIGFILFGWRVLLKILGRPSGLRLFLIDKNE